MHKIILLYIMGLLTVLTGQAQQNGFVLKGKIVGATPGQWIYLTDKEQTIVYDSVEMDRGHFEFTGTLQQPEIRYLIIYKDPAERDAWEKIIALPLFMENTLITVEAPYVKMPTKLIAKLSPEVEVKGGTIHQQYALFMKGYNELRQKYSDLYNRYGSIYYYQKGTEKEIFRLIKDIDHIRDSIFWYQCHFISHNTNSPLVQYIVEDIVIERYGRKVAEQIIECFPLEMQNTEKGQWLKKQLLHKPLYITDPLPDVNLLNNAGELVTLASQMKAGHYTLVEFWASWCGPCRSDIPYLKQTYEKYHSKGFDIISISIDDTPQTWKKAVKEENMPWLQLCDTGGEKFDKNGIRAFGVNGVPSGFLINPEGKVIQLKSRGGWLDMKLFELLNN